MDEFDLKRRLAALRRLANRYRRQMIGGAAAAILTIAIAVPALANDGTPATPLAPCGSTLPLTAACLATVTPAATLPGDYTVALPGGGTLTITIGADSLVTGAAVTGLTSFTASTPKVDGDKDKVTVTLTSTSTTTPVQVFNVKVSVKPTAGGLPTVTAKVKAAEQEEANEAAEAAEHGGGDKGEHHGGSGDGGHDHD